MRIAFKNHKGLTLIEGLVIMVVLFVLAGILLPALFKGTKKARRINCVNNLKQVGLSFRIYAGDYNDQYPMNVFTNNQLLVLETNEAHEYYSLIQNELGTPRVLICPEDKKRKATTNFPALRNANISYFVGLDTHYNFPGSILAGDRNITNGVTPVGGFQNLTTTQPAGFTSGIHTNQGNVALGDGSVQQVSNARLRSEIIANTGFATNRIKLP